MKGKKWTDKGRENEEEAFCKVQKGIPFLPSKIMVGTTAEGTNEKVQTEQELYAAFPAQCRCWHRELKT